MNPNGDKLTDLLEALNTRTTRMHGLLADTLPAASEPEAAVAARNENFVLRTPAESGCGILN